MARDVRITLAIMAVALLIGAPLIFADPGQPTSSYLALVFQDTPPTPIPTPVPPDISTLVIQLREMKSGYTQDEFHIATNADAAKTYHDPKAAAAAFIAQGRETSWYVRYGSTDYAFSDALGVASQVYRYLTPEGAAAGQAYTLAEHQLDHPDFRPFNVSTPCCPTVGLRRTFRSGNFNYDQYLISARVGRYVMDVQTIGLLGSIDVSRAVYYAQLELDHLTPVPQSMQATMLSAPAGEPSRDTIGAALSPR